MQTVRTLQVKVVLLTSIFECLAPISAPNRAINSDNDRYMPIIELLHGLNGYHGVEITKSQITDLVVSVYRMRNEFIHGGIKPYRTDIKIGSTTTSMGRLFIAAKMLCKLLLAQLLTISSSNRAIEKIGHSLGSFWEHGHLVPPEISLLS